jgi:hypothetical protein
MCYELMICSLYIPAQEGVETSLLPERFIVGVQ